MSFIIHPADAASLQDLGGKAAALAALGKADLPIPAWFVLTPAAFAASLTKSQQSALDTACAAGDSVASPLPAGEGQGVRSGGPGVRSALATLEPSPAVRAALDQAVAALCPAGELVAVRSSAVDEDSAQRSFAGQLDSFLDVPPSEVAARVAAVWRSGFSKRILAYRRANGLNSIPPAPAVLIQRMVHADTSGVAFSADPVSGRRAIAVVSAVHGLAAALVAGEAEGDTYHIDRAGQIISPLPMGEGPGVRSIILCDDEIRAVAALARRCARALGRPQDIEWAMEASRLYLLQSRPITTLAQLADPDGAFNLWDNSNIAESYGGVTTPLTFSFARHVYEQVYRQLVRVMGAPESLIVEHDNTFRHMLGLIQGRVYYNLLSWYRLLALLPGFTVNRKFMEQMMGVREGLPESIVAELARANWRDRLNDTRRLVLALAGLATNYVRLPRRIQRFYRRLDEALGTSTPDLSGLRADELVAYYRDLERRLITRWDAPLLNDLFAMVFYGLLRKLTGSWCGDAAGTLQNDLLSGEGGMISAEPAARVRALAACAARDPALVATLCAGTPDAIARALPDHPAFRAAYDAYLDKFADRCLEELKLESPTLRDDPLPLLRAVGHLAQRQLSPLGSPGGTEQRRNREVTSPLPNGRGAGGEVPLPSPRGRGAGGEVSPRRQAEQRVAATLARHPLRRLIFRWVLGGARDRVRDRENLRFERTRVFGRVRLIFVELGRRFHALDLLTDPREIFYLEVEEVLGYVEGTATTTNLRGLVALRQAEFARYRALEPPADRFATRGIVYQGNMYQSMRPDTATTDTGDDRRQGIGCSPGLVRGPVRVVRDPKGARLDPGAILVAERTDPGWIMLFPAAAGVLVERGSLLSHSAIVARELGIPTIVSLAGLTHWLADGDWVEMDGATGVVARIASPAPPDTAPGGSADQPHEEPAHA